MKELRMLSGGGMVHADGVAKKSLDSGIEMDPDFIGVDCGSSDAGPYYLGSGENLQGSKEAAKRVYEVYLDRALKHDIPLLLGSAATAGANHHVDWTKDIILEIAEENDYQFNLASIYTEQSDADLKRYNDEGKIFPLGESDSLSDDDIENSDHVVGVMGPEGFIEAVDQGADVVLAGRTSDVSIFKALPVKEGFDEGLATHLAKLLECSGMIAKPKQTGECMFGIIREDHFQVKTTRDEKHTDPLTVASHMLYENPNPYRLTEPGGVCDTSESTYEQVDDRTVEVRGSQWEERDYTIKLEGAREAGHRSLTAFGIRDPIAIEHVDHLIESCKDSVAEKASEMKLNEDEYNMAMNVYGRDGVLRESEPVDSKCHEIGFIITTVAPTEDAADTLAGNARLEMLHEGYPNRKATAGNVAFPISPPDLSAGKAYEWSVLHAIQVESPNEPFDIKLERIKKNDVAPEVN
jgi:hypothetical protein